MKQEYVRCAEKIACSISFEKFCTDSNSALLPARRDNLGSMQFKACICTCVFGNINRSMRFVQGGGAKSDLPNNYHITIVMNQIFSQIRYFSLPLYTTSLWETWECSFLPCSSHCFSVVSYLEYTFWMLFTIINMNII